ncbi:hypothetical protein [Leadbetterella byssophila]|uniref:hypothetical protein n=1 Tax=Leadbetterella byssophila TaxID=316068 RepID=UPI0039A1BE86
MKVEAEDKNFYKGLSLSFDKSETRLLMISENKWFDCKSVAYCTTEITEDEFNLMLDRAIKK